MAPNWMCEKTNSVKKKYAPNASQTDLMAVGPLKKKKANGENHKIGVLGGTVADLEEFHEVF